ncbi:MAG: double zinc ribbon domain-containing protein [Candidatus Gracilibacteria bacterium]
MIFDVIKNSILNLLFPKYCLNCKERGEFLCANCLTKISFLQNQQCPKCRRPNLIGNFCDQQCRKDFYFDQLIVCCQYGKNALIKKLITSFKYNFLRELRLFLATILKTQFIYLSQFINLEKNIIFIPVPIHKKRLLYRGFNQAAELSEMLLKILKNDSDFGERFWDITALDCLTRDKYSEKQANLQRAERLNNLAGTITLNNSLTNLIKNKFCILIDDVSTTCATLNECSKILKRHGANYVCGLVLARGV